MKPSSARSYYEIEVDVFSAKTLEVRAGVAYRPSCTLLRSFSILKRVPLCGASVVR